MNMDSTAARIDASFALGTSKPNMALRSDIEKSKYARWWESDAGKEARQLLDAWAAVVRVREATGDDSALPSGGGGLRGRGSPSDPPSVLVAYLDVDVVMQRLTQRQRELVMFVHGHGFERKPISVRYLLQLPDKEENWTEWMSPTARPPAKFVRSREELGRMYEGIDLAKFSAPEFEAVALGWKRDKRRLLEVEHYRIGIEVEASVGLAVVTM